MIFAGDTTRISYEELVTLRTLKETAGSPVPVASFVEQVDIDSFLEEGESIEDLIQEDPDTNFYRLVIHDETFFGIHNCGRDCLFSADGTMPVLDLDLDSSLNEQLRRSQLAWVLAPCGSLLASGPMGEEVETFRTARLARFDGSNGSTRLQLLMDGKAVCGMQIKDNTVEALYTDYKCTRQGLASRLFDYAYRQFPELEHNQSLTENGKSFVTKYEDRRSSKTQTNDVLEP